jgi:RNA polymerase sigma factor (sigma-70 family)
MLEAPDELTQVDDALFVHEALKELPEHCAEILDRFFARDESYRTIGDALDLPPGTIASRISRCLRKLRAQLEGRKPRFEPSSGSEANRE